MPIYLICIETGSDFEIRERYALVHGCPLAWIWHSCRQTCRSGSLLASPAYHTARPPISILTTSFAARPVSNLQWKRNDAVLYMYIKKV